MSIGKSGMQALPLERWTKDMQTAVEEICELGTQLLQTHGKSSEAAAAIADKWCLPQRLAEEREALSRAFKLLQGVLVSVDATWQAMQTANEFQAQMQSMEACANKIEQVLPQLQQEFLSIRRSALDLLRWERRYATVEGSELPAKYRESYRRLLAYTPVFRPFLEAMQKELLERSNETHATPELQQLLAALNHYVAAVESARAFVQSVVDPPLDLVFQDTESFDSDWKQIAAAKQGQLATELNDCCQLLLYEPSSFHKRVENIQQSLTDGVDASLYVLPVEDWRIIFGMDEDPVFEQLIVTMLRVVPAGQLDATVALLIDDLYRDLARDDG